MKFCKASLIIAVAVAIYQHRKCASPSKIAEHDPTDLTRIPTTRKSKIADQPISHLFSHDAPTQPGHVTTSSQTPARQLASSPTKYTPHPRYLYIRTPAI
jgi:hypothetical protein